MFCFFWPKGQQSFRGRFLCGLVVLTALCSLQSCHTAGTLNVSGISYRSINTKRPQTKDAGEAIDNASILAGYAIDKNGSVAVVIRNLTDEIMIINQEMSFFINSDGSSVSYFDPTVKTQTTTDLSSGTKGASLNLGAISSALGIGGPLGTLLSGTTVGSSSTNGQAVSNTVYIADQKNINVGPRGNVALSKTFKVSGVGKNYVPTDNHDYEFTYKNSPVKFSICISYSIDNGETFEKMVTDFYVSSQIYMPVVSLSSTNTVFRELIKKKPDLMSQPWYSIYFINNIAKTIGDDSLIPFSYTDDKNYDNITQGMIYDFQ